MATNAVWSDQAIPQPVSPMGPSLQKLTITQIAAGGEHTMVLTSLGRLFACGQSEYGQLGPSATGAEGKRTHCLSPIDVNLGGQSEDVVEIACGVHHCIAVGSTGNVCLTHICCYLYL